jgi:hypothetical protein
MSHFRIRRRLLAASLGLGGVTVAWSLGFAATGNAAWVVTGSGHASSVTAATASPLSVTGADAATGLYPTGSRTVTFTVHNPNDFDVTLDSATVSSIAVSGGKDAAACGTATIAGLTASMDPGAVGTEIPAGGDSAAFAVTVSMSAASDDACQGVVATPSVTVQGTAS